MAPLLDSAVSTKLLNLCVDIDVRKFTHLRHSAAAGDLNNFKYNGSTLHQMYCGLSIIMTMYEANNPFTSIMQCPKDHYVFVLSTEIGTIGRKWWSTLPAIVTEDQLAGFQR